MDMQKEMQYVVAEAIRMVQTGGAVRRALLKLQPQSGKLILVAVG